MATRNISVRINRNDSDRLPYDVLNDKLDELWKQAKSDFIAEELARRNQEA